MKSGLMIGMLAGFFFLAEIMRRKSGVGWFDFLSPLGKYVVYLKPNFKKPFTLGSMFAIVIAGIILYFTLSPTTLEKEKAKEKIHTPGVFMKQMPPPPPPTT